MSDEPLKPQPPGSPKNLHYRLTCEEWLCLSQKLKFAELRILLYLRTLDPFGDRPLNLKVIDIAETTGLQKGTVSKALRSLSDLGYIDLEMVTIRIQNKFPTENNVSPEKPKEFPTVPPSFPQETSTHHRKPLRTVGNIQQSEPAQAKDSRTPDTIHTLKTIQTLSEPPKKRESLEADPAFRTWLQQKASQLPNPPQLIEQWISKQAKLDSNQKDYLKSTGSVRDSNVPPPPPPDRFQIESSCIAASGQGDRPFILTKLRQLWLDGWSDLVTDLCRLYPNWGIIPTTGGIIEAAP